MPPAVSIITVYYNATEDLKNLWNSIQTHVPSETYEFIVADNHSDVDLSAELPGAIYLRLPQNYGFAKANNLASKRATGKHFFFVNPDCLFIDDCLTPLIAVMDRAGIAAPRILNPDRSVQVSFGRTLSLLAEIAQRIRVRFERGRIIQQWLRKKTSRLFSPGFVGGAALLIQSDLFRRLNGFDDRFFLYEEDVDLCERARKMGETILYVPSSRIIHLRGTSASRNAQTAALEYRKSQILFYEKHRHRLQLFLLRAYLSLKFLFRPAMLNWIWNHRNQINETKKMPVD